jgi:uncharacterized protein (UPF0333 family)
MIFRKKGQAAMEFLMTYGWALLVVLIAIAALAFFGLLNPSRFLPEKCEIAPGLTCVGFTAEAESLSEGNISIILNNGIGVTMRNVTINATACTNNAAGEVKSETDFWVGNQTNTSMIGQEILSEGSSKLFKINCTGMDKGTRFKTDLDITYLTKVESNELSHSRNGFLVVEVS